MFSLRSYILLGQFYDTANSTEIIISIYFTSTYHTKDTNYKTYKCYCEKKTIKTNHNLYTISSHEEPCKVN